MTHPQPFLRLHSVSLFVKDLDLSIDFYVNSLGFLITFEHRFATGERIIGVSPPDGSALFVITAPVPGSAEHTLIGKSRGVALVTDDVNATHRLWTGRGVRFLSEPGPIETFGRYATFEDLDGNEFLLLGFDEVTRTIEAQRRAEAEKLHSERLAAQEFEFAKQVQARLFPQMLPSMQGFDFAGECVQARHVGGDYYDFIVLSEGRAAVVIADVSGKGMPAALLMANLQASLRGHSAIAAERPERLLASVNRLFYENTIPSAYATLFYADLEEATGRFRYVNCGHLPALILRATGGLQRLPSNATVLGMFPALDCEGQECCLSYGDALLLYTDGVTEATNSDGEEFGEERLIDALRRYGGQDAQPMVRSILADVQQFSGVDRHDDITLVVAKRRPEAGTCKIN